MSEPRAWTTEEVRQRFVAHARYLAQYWANVNLCKVVPELIESDSSQYRIEGALFSLLAAIDGVAVDLPAFMLVPLPAPSDKQNAIENGENWYPYPVLNDTISDNDIAGNLHDIFHVQE